MSEEANKGNGAAPETAAPKETAKPNVAAENKKPGSASKDPAPASAADESQKPAVSVAVEVGGKAEEKPKKSGGPFTGARALLGDRKALRTQIADLKAENDRLQGELAEAKAKADKLQSLEGEVEEFRAEVARLEKEQTTVQAELETVGVTQDEAPETVALEDTPQGKLEHFKTLAGAARTAYLREHKAALEQADAELRNGKAA